MLRIGVMGEPSTLFVLRHSIALGLEARASGHHTEVEWLLVLSFRSSDFSYPRDRISGS